MICNNITEIIMSNILKVSTEQIHFELGPNDERSFYKLEL